MGGRTDHLALKGVERTGLGALLGREERKFNYEEMYANTLVWTMRHERLCMMRC